jgi:beta-glucanase (GH16 family)
MTELNSSQIATASQGAADPLIGELIWSQEFDSVGGAEPSTEFWSHETGDGAQFGLQGWGNQELQYYTPQNVSQDGGSNLVLRAEHLAGPTSADAVDSRPSAWYGPAEFTSARITTKEHMLFEYGRYEVRAKVPAGSGTWSAFWMLGHDIQTNPWPSSGEIDVMEQIGREPNRVFGTLHCAGHHSDHGFGKTLDLPFDLADEYHTYGVNWQPNQIDWFIDDNLYFSATPEAMGAENWVFDKPYYLLLNLAIGGGLGGEVAHDLTNPANLEVDYIRVYKYNSFGRTLPVTA